MSIARLVNLDGIRMPDGLDPALSSLMEGLIGNLQTEIDYIESHITEEDELTAEADGVTVSVNGGGGGSTSTLQIEIKRNVVLHEGENIIAYDTDFDGQPATVIQVRDATNRNTRDNQMYDETAQSFKVFVWEPCLMTYIGIYQ